MVMTNGTNSNTDSNSKYRVYYTENNSIEEDTVVKYCNSHEMSMAILGILHELTKNGRILNGRIIIESPNKYTTVLYPTYNTVEPTTNFEKQIFNEPNILPIYLRRNESLIQNKWFNIDVNRYLNYLYKCNTVATICALRDLAKELDKAYGNDPIKWIDQFIKDSSKLGHVICSTGKCVHHTFSHDLYNYNNPRHTLIFISDKALPIFLGSRDLTRNEILETGNFEIINEYKEIRKFDNSVDAVSYIKKIQDKTISADTLCKSNINVSSTIHKDDINGFEYLVSMDMTSGMYPGEHYLYMSQAINSNRKNPHGNNPIYEFDIEDCSGKVYCKPAIELSDKSIVSVSFANRINIIPSELLEDKVERKISNSVADENNKPKTKKRFKRGGNKNESIG